MGEEEGGRAHSSALLPGIPLVRHTSSSIYLLKAGENNRPRWIKAKTILSLIEQTTSDDADTLLDNKETFTVNVCACVNTHVGVGWLKSRPD